MERTASRVRPSSMMKLRVLRGRAGFPGLLGLLGAGLLFAADPAAAGATTTATPAAQQVGCASVEQATAVSIRHLLHLMVPVGSNPLATTTYRQPAKGRAVFGQLCAAV